MTASLGPASLIVAIVGYTLCIASTYQKFSSKLLKAIYIFSGICVVISFSSLLLAFVKSDFSIQNVLLNSSTLKPLKYKIAASWASHESSLLFWSALIAVASIASIFLEKNNIRLRSLICFSSLIIFFFITFTYFCCNPFTLSYVQAREGMGLNPLLQDIGLVIHPPLLYCGYACYFVPFIYSVMLTSNQYGPGALATFHKVRIFSNLGWFFLTSGIFLGSWWAYRELGWGGYWIFDPVENISLMVWISATALHHSLLSKDRKLIPWSIFFSFTTFFLSILGTFFVRSNLLMSVHSFALSSNNQYYMLAFIILVFMFGATRFLLYNSINSELITQENNSIVKILILGNIIWLISIVLILISLIYPSVYEFIYDHKITISINYFINLFIPLLLPILFLSALSFYFFHRNNLVYRLLLTIVIVASFCYFSSYGISKIIVAIALSVYLIIESSYSLLKATKIFTKRASVKIVSMSISHFGLGLIVLAISFNSFLKEEADFIGKVGDNLKFSRFNLVLKNIRYAQEKNYLRQIAEFWVEDSNKSQIAILSPENRLYIVEKAVASKSNVYSSLLADFYISINNIDSDLIYAKIYYKPGMALLWIGGIIMISGMLMSLFLNKTGH